MRHKVDYLKRIAIADVILCDVREAGKKRYAMDRDFMSDRD
jgi:hypothetical protein